MKKFLSLIIFAALLLAATANISLADSKHARHRHHKRGEISSRQNSQEKRIKKGVQKGGLTPEEAAKLQAEQNAIKAQRNAARADGVVTAKERKTIKSNQKQAGKNIQKERHDSQRTR